MYRNILFDLDGTLTDPKEGITKCVQYALRSQGIEENDLQSLLCYIGPPLQESFQGYGGLSEQDAWEAVMQYRVRFQEKGMFENRVFAGVEEMLRRLKAEGRRLAIASSKPEVFVVKILEHYGLLKYFDATVGGNLDGTRTDKAEVVAEALARLKVSEREKAETVMVGDRMHDIAGARKNGLNSIGVRFGYAEKNELEEAGATSIADTMEDLEILLLR